MKHVMFLIPFFILTALHANIQDDRKELMEADKELFIANKQVVLLKEQYDVEKRNNFV